MTTDPQRSDDSTGLALSWLLALILAPLALAWALGDAVVRTLRARRKVRT